MLKYIIEPGAGVAGDGGHYEVGGAGDGDHGAGDVSDVDDEGGDGDGDDDVGDGDDEGGDGDDDVGDGDDEGGGAQLLRRERRDLSDGRSQPPAPRISGCTVSTQNFFSSLLYLDIFHRISIPSFFYHHIFLSQNIESHGTSFPFIHLYYMTQY